MECLYYVEGVDTLQGITYALLLDWCARRESEDGWDLTSILNLADVVYSNDNVANQVSQYDKIMQNCKLKLTPTEYHPDDYSRFINGEYPDKNSETILLWLETPSAKLNGEDLVTKLSSFKTKEDFYNYYSGRYMSYANGEGFPIDRVNKHLELVKQSLDAMISTGEGEAWQRIQKAEMAIHNAITHKSIWSNNSSSNDFLGAVTDPAISNTVRHSLYTLLRNFFISELKSYDGARVIADANFKSKFIDSDKEILGHVDYIFIDSKGTLHAYLFKTSTLEPNDWQIIKEDRYRMQLSTIKRMLANNGLNVTNMTLDIVPIQLEYNNDFTVLLKVNVHGSRNAIRRYSTNRLGKYNLTLTDTKIVNFILSHAPEMRVPPAPLKHANQVINAIFPECNIIDSGFDISAKMRIAQAPSVGLGDLSLVIREVGDVGHGYDVYINGKKHEIVSNKPKNLNQEILDLVKAHLEELASSTYQAAADMSNEVQRGLNRDPGEDRPFSANKYGELRSNLYGALGRYMPYYNKTTGKMVSDWKQITTYLDNNILIFYKDHPVTHETIVDVVSLTPFNINAKTQFRRGDNLLGSYLTSLQYVSLEANYGNMEAVRVMTILNEAIASEELKGARLGSLTILSTIPSADFLFLDIGEFHRTHYMEILKLMKSLVPNVEFYDNFTEAKITDPCEAVLEMYNKIVDSDNESLYDVNYSKKALEYLNMDKLLSPDEIDDSLPLKINNLLTLLKNILRRHPEFKNVDEVRSALKDRHHYNHNIAVLYDIVTKAYLYYTGDTVVRARDFDDTRSLMMVPYALPDENVRHVVDNFQVTSDQILFELLQRYERRIADKFMKYYHESGYSLIENMVIGSLRRVYTNLIDPDPEKLMSFKNPYDMTNDLNTHERELLKDILYEFELIRNTSNSSRLDKDNVNLMREYINDHPAYLWVPLERASKATRRASIDALVSGLKNFFKGMKNMGEWFALQMMGMTFEEAELLGNRDEYLLIKLHNRFDSSMPTSDLDYNSARLRRAVMIDKYGRDYFEINLEKITLDYLTRTISTRLFNNFLIATNALLLLLLLSGNHWGNETVVAKEVEYILKYLKKNVFLQSIMGKKGKAITSVLNPLRRLATKLLIGGNMAGMARDTILGIENNYLRTITKFNTDIDAKSVTQAYYFVTRYATSNAMAMNLLSKLCVRFRLAGTDIESVAGRMRTGRNGILNYENYLFGTMRTPDFMNRMVLFVARCIHDGVLDPYHPENSALFINDQNFLLYDWKKDKRFSAYARGELSNPNYVYQKSVYLSKLRQYKIDNPSVELNDGDPLPTPYSSLEIRNIQALADNIYGAYDTSKKAMFEHIALGWAFGQFYSWTGGTAINWFAKPHRGVTGKIELILDVDENGRPLYFNDDGTVTTTETSMKVWRDIPAIVQGVQFLGRDAWYLTRDGGFSEFKKYIASSPLAKALGLKLVSDLLLAGLLTLLFKLIFNPAYNEYKKEDMLNNPFLLNVAFEVIFKGGLRSISMFWGPYIFYNFFLGGGQLPFVSANWNLIRQLWAGLTGSKDWMSVWSNLGGFSRFAHDSILAEVKKRKLDE